MNDSYEDKLEILRKKVEQQELTICQLVKIVAATNNKVSHLTNREKREQRHYTFN